MDNKPLFENSNVIKLDDDDFNIKTSKTGHPIVTLINDQFRNKDGYIMIYASWCPHCRAKEDFWSYLADQFNVNPEFKKENFRIGVIDAENPKAQKVRTALQVGPIPRFMHVVPNPKRPGEETLIDYEGSDLTPESLIGEICDLSPYDTLCESKKYILSNLNPPEIRY